MKKRRGWKRREASTVAILDLQARGMSWVKAVRAVGGACFERLYWRSRCRIEKGRRRLERREQLLRRSRAKRLT